MKRPRPTDLHEGTANRPSTFNSYIFSVFMDMWRALTPQSIVAVHTSSPNEFGNSAKRRAVASEDIRSNIRSIMPGHYPGASLPSLQQPSPKMPTTPTSSPPRLADSQTNSMSQSCWSLLYSWISSPQNANVSSIQQSAQAQLEAHSVAASVAPSLTARDEHARHVPRKHMSIKDRLAEIAKYESAEKTAPPELRHSYRVHSPTYDTQQQTPPPRTTFNGRQSLSLRQRTGAARDQDVDGLISRLRTVTHKSPEDARFREEQRLRDRRLANEKGRAGRAQERAEQERKALEKEKVQEEQKEFERLQAEREADLRAQEEQKALEAAQAADEAAAAQEAARKNVLIRPLEPKWVAIVEDAMSTTNPAKIFAKSPDGTDINRYVLGRILPQEGEGEVITANGGKQGRSAWLNDECVDNWIAMIVARRLEQEGYVKGPNNTPSVASYLSAFWKTYKDKGAEGIRSWSRRKGISGKKLLKVEQVFFPVNAGSHWILLVISPISRTIEVLDSLHSGSSAYWKFAHEWLAMELGADYDRSEWENSKVQSATQQNFDDCGVFTCFNALARAKNMAASDVVATDGMQEARKMMVAVLLNGGFREDWEL